MRRSAKSTRDRAGAGQPSGRKPGGGKPAARPATPRRDLEQRLAAALEQQAATAEILRVIARSPGDVQPVFDAIVDSAARLCEADFSAAARLEDGLLHLTAVGGMSPAEIRAYHSLFPRPVHRGFIMGRAVVEARPVHVEDVLADPEYEPRTLGVLQRAARYRTFLGIPIVRHGVTIGVIGCGRRAVKPFTEDQIRLVETFADQAVIAIENARLFAEAGTRNRDLTEALEQQTATAEILRVISGSPTDVQPVFDAIARSARRLCDGEFCFVLRFDGALQRFGAADGLTPEGLAALHRSLPRPAGDDTGAGRAIARRAVVQIPDVQADPAYGATAVAQAVTYRGLLAAPMLREGTPIGAITVSRAYAGPFSERQVALLETFAEQAVIAVENVRLFTELEVRNRAMTEALEQQTATGEILEVISSSPTDVQPVFDAIARSAQRLCQCDLAWVFRFDGRLVHLAAHHGLSSAGAEVLNRPFPRAPNRDFTAGRAILSGAVAHIPDVQADPEYRLGDTAAEVDFRATLAVPMLRDDAPIGAISVTKRESGPFSARQIALLETFADQAVIAIENVRLFTELDARNRDLTDALEQQTATAEILSAISSSPADIRPVLEAVVRAAARFCGAPDVILLRVDGPILRGAAATGQFREAILSEIGSLDALEVPLTRGSMTGRAVLDRHLVHVHDLAAAAEDDLPEGRELQRRYGHRAFAAAPLLREGTPLGALGITRMTPDPFSDRQLELLRTFADQAVIAIENVRLFTELQERNRDLGEALEQQTATAEVLKVISRAATDLGPVLHTLIESATRLCGATRGHVFTFDGELLRFAAAHGAWPGFESYLEQRPLRPGPGSAAGLAAAERRAVHILDVRAEPGYEWGALTDLQDYRTVLAVPLLREATLLGVITILRTRVAPFTDKQIDLLTTFADQAVIAIENARLFTELESRNRDLTETLEQQTATAEILRVISGSPTDVQPVFDAIAQSARRLCEGEFTFVFRFDGAQLDFGACDGLTEEGIQAFRAELPRPAGEDTAAGRAILHREVAEIPDAQVEAGYGPRALARLVTYRSLAAVPMLREGHPIGAITVARAPAGHFPERQIALLRTFAEQAVIAVENVRLFTELESRNSELRTALEQQTATSELLKVIGRSTFDLQPVFETLAENAVRLCEAERGLIFRADGALLRFAVGHNVSPELRDFFEANPIAPDRHSNAGRAALERRTVHNPDVLSDPEYTYGGARVDPYRTVLAVPMLRAEELFGVILIYRHEVRPFTDQQIALVETFADQAAIAVENARLLSELQARNADLSEALEQQTATSEILRIISTSPSDLRPVLETVAENAARLCAADDGHIWQRDGDGAKLVASWGGRPVGRQRLLVGRRSVVGRAIHDRAPVHVADLAAAFDTEFPDSQRMKDLGYRTILAVPLLREGTAIGAIMIRRTEVRPFSEGQVALVETFADQAVIAIENVRLFEELETRNRDLTETLEQQTATAEILRVISQSPTDVQPVFDTIVASAVRLCGARMGAVYRFDGERLHLVAHHNYSPEVLEVLRQMHPRPPQGELASDRAILTRAVAQVEDTLADPQYPNQIALVAGGFRSVLAVPLLRDGAPIGVIVITRGEAGRFADGHVELVKTFADQAVIAIQNVRLFTELEARNSELRVSLEQQTATGEILRVISSSPTDVQPVFETIAQSARRLCDASICAVFRFDGQQLHFIAHHGLTAEGVEASRRDFPAAPDRGSTSGRAILSGAVEQIPDVDTDPDYALRGLARIITHRSIVAVPMLREGVPIGVITVSRGQVGLLPDRQIALLKTFADQAVIAIENVRLFKELEARNRDLTETLEQQTATSEILRVISSSPTDIQPVLDAVAENAARLCEATDAQIFRVEGDFLRRVASFGSIPIHTGRPITRGWVTGRSVVDRTTIHVHDLAAESDAEYPIGRETQTLFGHRTTLATPLLREGRPLGAILIRRMEVRPFSDKQIRLLESFADQAVIAIENVRLFRELQARNVAITEALEQQTATGEILRVISQSPTDAQPVFEIIAQRARRLCEAEVSVISRVVDEVLQLAAVDGVTEEGRAAARAVFPLRRDDETVSARTFRSGAIIHTADVLADAQYQIRDFAQTLRFRAGLGVPMLREGQVAGVIFVGRATAGLFADTQVELLKTFADQAVIAIENVRLFRELEARNAAITEALEQQTATSELLKVIGRSTFDLQPVFDTLAENAVRLCEARHALIFRFDGQLLRVVATHNVSAELREYTEQNPIPLGRGTASGRAALERRTVHIHDVWADPEYTYAKREVDAYRTLIAIPMLRADELLGVIIVQRYEVRPFTDSQIALMETFADQAAIAIENARLLTELQTRTGQLTRSVQELRALGEVSRAVSSTLDLDAVLETIVSRAVQLSGCDQGIVYEFDEADQSFHARATHRVSPQLLAAIRAAAIRLGESAVGRAGLTRQPVEVADLEDEMQIVAPRAREGLLREGMRSFLAVPLAREDRLLGGLVIASRRRGVFSPEVVATLQTFAAQSALAIHNAGLFREIQRQKQYSETLVETSPVAIVTMDLRGAVVGWNPGAERLFGHTQAEALGRPMEDLVATPELREEVRANIRQTLEGEWIRAIARRARKDGSPVDVEISSVPVVVDGARVGMIGIYHDITELLAARREAEAANEAKGAFLATMSHEIRTPMNAVIGMSGLLLGTALTDEQREYAEVVRQSGDALLTVINDILDFSKIEAGKLELESQPFDVRDCVESALDLVATRAAEKGLDLAYLIGEGVPAAVVGDVTRLRQILLNLLSNAVKFTERGEVVLTVSAHRPDGGAPLHELTFSVRDTGIGIPADRLGRLFQSFSQVDASTTRRYGGTGLGLAISQRLAELMGGRIGVTSEVGAGSDFRLTIRAAAAEAPSPARRDLTGVQPSLRGKRVLVVDDNGTNRRILSAHLDAWGMPERSTPSPVEALAWIEAGERFDVAILDMHMPEMDGVALARRIRQHPAGTALPLILFTSLGRREARAEEEGFAAYLHKPIKPSQLFDALVSILAEQPVHVAPRSVARTEIDPETARRHPLRILLAEDNVVNQKVALRILGQMGYRADVAGNGLEAIDAVGRQTYDVVLMDVQMPEMDGFEASREINHRWPGARRPRLVAMTANAMQGDRELCAAAGMDDYVAKPIRVEDLVAALGRCPRRPDAAPRLDASASIATAEAKPTPGASPAQPEAPGEASAPAVPPGAPDAAAIDRAAVDRLIATMGAEFVAELIDTFGQDARDQIAALERALAAADVDVFRRAAHSLKSTSESLGAAGLAALARGLETAARTGRLEGTEDKVTQLAGTFEAAARALMEIRRGLTA